MPRRGSEPGAVGFRVKSGWAAAVLLGGSAKAPEVLDHRIVQLSEPALPASRQPFHLGLDLPPAQGARLVGPLVESVESFGRRSVLELLEVYRNGRRLRCVGIVVGSVVDPASIANEHIRAHAAEGRLFREVIERAAGAVRLKTIVLVDKRLGEDASQALGKPAHQLKADVAALGRGIPGPWRSEQKAAALGAWVALAQCR